MLGSCKSVGKRLSLKLFFTFLLVHIQEGKGDIRDFFVSFCEFDDRKLKPLIISVFSGVEESEGVSFFVAKHFPDVFFIGKPDQLVAEIGVGVFHDQFFVFPEKVCSADIVHFRADIVIGLVNVVF